ncbi:MAG: hypothetical protein IJS53_02810 [Clostridia bacterium]|nr:hypothetical protein [Clostridia bacterium]
MKKIICLLLALISVLSLCAPALAEEEKPQVTITNCDYVVVRDEAGNVLGRLMCCAPVIVWEEKGEMSFITFPKSLMEIWTDDYVLSDYRGTYVGINSGWVKTKSLSQTTLDIETLFVLAEQSRWEMWVNGLYHWMTESGLRSNKNYEEHAIPKADGIEIQMHTNLLDIRHKDDVVWLNNPTYSRKVWVAAYHCDNAIDIANRLTDEVQDNTTELLVMIWQNISAIESLSNDAVFLYGEGKRIISNQKLGNLYAFVEASLAAVQEEQPDIAELRAKLIEELEDLRYGLLTK